MNKYLTKLAYDSSVNYNVNDNYYYDESREQRMDEADMVNSILLNRGYKPVITDAPHDLAMGRLLTDLDFKTWHKPNRASATGKGLLAGLVSGGTAWATTAAYTKNPLLAGLAGIGVGIGGGMAVGKASYSDAKKQEDEASMKEGTNKLLAHLAKHYSQL